MNNRWLAMCALMLGALHGCGSGGGDSSSSSSTTTSTTTPVAAANTLALTVDGGPAALQSTGVETVNTLFATVTICTPGSTTACKTVDHVLVDTGSVGIRIIASALGGAAVPTLATDPTTGGPLRECAQFADGYSYGSVATADVQLGGRTLAALPIQLIGDAAAGSAPASCVSGPSENTVATFGSNGVIGVGSFTEDCGAACASSAISGVYYACPTRNAVVGCAPTAVALARQIPNPVSQLTSDNNGVTIQLPSLPTSGAASTSGTLYFGVATQADNALASARFLTLTSSGTLTVTYNGTARSGSFIDSGSNGNFFTDASIALCSDSSGFYCPVTASGAATTLSLSAIVTGANGVSSTVGFTVGNADQYFSSTSTALPGLAGRNTDLANASSSAFDFGLPFFYGRTVYVLIAGSSVNGTAGPAIAF